MDFRDRRVWITGASSGIGEALALAFHQAGAKLILSARREDELKRVQTFCGDEPNTRILPMDVTNATELPEKTRLALGKHVLEFSKQGFNTGKFPLGIGADDVSGGSVSYELGNSAHDTVELRDGNVLTCDVESMSATEVVISIGGARQHLDRNQVKRMLLVERDPPPAH